MNVSLTPQLEKFVNDKVTSGMYNSASEVVRDALRLLDERDRLREMRMEDLRKEIAIGLEQLERGQVKDFDAEEIMRRGRELLAREKRAG